MRMTSFVSASVVVIALAVTMTSVSADQSSTVDVVKPSPMTSSTSQLATLRDVKAVPMASSELDAVKGLHVHFLDGGRGKEHLAGVNNTSNWSWKGGSDGMPTAPSYNGLCVAMRVGKGGISIPGGASQCP
jgi:hypothetical protein